MDTREYRRKRTRRKRPGIRLGIQLEIAAGLVGFLFAITVLLMTLTGAGKQGNGAVQTAVGGSSVSGENEPDAVISAVQSESDTPETSSGGEEMADLKEVLRNLVSTDTGDWSIYVKNLSNGASLSINNQSMYAASLIKLFVMEETYANIDTVIGNIETYGDSPTEASDTLSGLLELMIEQSDNESYNEIVRLHSDSYSFTEGCLAINEYLQSGVYSDTGIYHTLSPSNTESESTSATEKNHTSVEDCGRLLEAIYDGTCVSEAASAKMLNFLLNQGTTWKIPAGVPDGIAVANKTGETDDYEHDAAIVYGEEADYILCVMSGYSATSAITMIRKISKIVYAYLNGVEDWETAGDEDEQEDTAGAADGDIADSIWEEPDDGVSHGADTEASGDGLEVAGAGEENAGSSGGLDGGWGPDSSPSDIDDSWIEGWRLPAE